MLGVDTRLLSVSYSAGLLCSLVCNRCFRFRLTVCPVSVRTIYERGCGTLEVIWPLVDQDFPSCNRTLTPV